MDNRWFKEDRALPKGEQAEAIAETEKVLKNSTLIVRRLKAICEDEIQRTYRAEEDIENPAYTRIIIGAASRRKALKDIINILP
jgi:hypothetical protein